MARIKGSMIGAMSGTVGNMVASKWREVEFVRGKGGFRTDNPSAAQLVQRAKFKLVTSFTRSIAELLNTTYTDFTSKMTGMNLALAQIIQNAVTGTYPNFSLDYSRILISNSFKLPITQASALAAEPGKVGFTWEDISDIRGPEPDDQSILVAYCPEIGHSVYTWEGPPRSAGTASLSASPFRGKQVHTWLAFRSLDGKVSTSFYTGAVTVL
jgi:hypothetical protein